MLVTGGCAPLQVLPLTVLGRDARPQPVRGRVWGPCWHTDTQCQPPVIAVASPAIWEKLCSQIIKVSDELPGPGEPDPDATVPRVLGDPVGRVVCCDARELKPGIRCNRTDEAVPGAAPAGESWDVLSLPGSGPSSASGSGFCHPDPVSPGHSPGSHHHLASRLTGTDPGFKIWN